jgi:hypothetical protein
MKRRIITIGNKQIVVARGPRADKLAVLEKNAIRPEDVPPCSDCGKPADPAIRGYDSKWRDLRCNETHMDSVLGESGDSAPNASEDKSATTIAVPKGMTGVEARRAAIIDQFGRKQPPTTEEEIAGVRRAQVVQRVSPPNGRETDEQRRARILEKYGVRRSE